MSQLRILEAAQIVRKVIKGKGSLSNEQYTQQRPQAESIGDWKPSTLADNSPT